MSICQNCAKVETKSENQICFWCLPQNKRPVAPKPTLKKSIHETQNLTKSAKASRVGKLLIDKKKKSK